MNLIEFIILIIVVLFIVTVIVPLIVLSFLGKVTWKNAYKIYEILFKWNVIDVKEKELNELYRINST